MSLLLTCKTCARDNSLPSLLFVLSTPLPKFYPGAALVSWKTKLISVCLGRSSATRKRACSVDRRTIDGFDGCQPPKDSGDRFCHTWVILPHVATEDEMNFAKKATLVLGTATCWNLEEKELHRKQTCTNTCSITLPHTTSPPRHEFAPVDRRLNLRCVCACVRVSGTHTHTQQRVT